MIAISFSIVVSRAQKRPISPIWQLYSTQFLPYSERTSTTSSISVKCAS